MFTDRIGSPIGALLVFHDEAGRLRALDFEDYEPRMRRLLRLQWGEEGRDFVVAERPVPASVRQALTAYFAGDPGAVDSVPVALAGTPFQREVWTALRTIPPGTTLSYGALASRLGRPTSVRAVGLANGANPVAIVVPCHRVIGTDGSLTGYGGGIARKKWLLTHEGAAFRDSAAPRLRQVA
jgi:methylated-DNA-[protein]-cysteine S-methyltransferase